MSSMIIELLQNSNTNIIYSRGRFAKDRSYQERKKSENQGMWMPQQKKVWEILSFPLVWRRWHVAKIRVFGKEEKSISKGKLQGKIPMLNSIMRAMYHHMGCFLNPRVYQLFCILSPWSIIHHYLVTVW